MSEVVPCSNCRGSGSILALVDYGPPREHASGLHTIPCPECDGAGTLPVGERARRAQRRAEGVTFRRARVAAGMSLHTAAHEFGVSVVVVSQWERGRAELPAAARAWLDARAVVP